MTQNPKNLAAAKAVGWDDPPADLDQMIESTSRPAGSPEPDWNQIGRGEGGFYDHIREEGCASCGCHTPGNCDGCA